MTIANLDLSLKLDSMLWKSIKPSNETEELSFYRNTPFEFIKNLVKNMDGMHQDIFDYINNIIAKNDHKSILDYGGGSGYLSMRLHNKGYNVTFSEVNLLSLEWMDYITKKKNMDIKIIDLYNNKITNKYDVIIIKDVAEHVSNPDKLLNELKKMTNNLIVLPGMCLGEEDYLPMHKQMDASKILNSTAIDICK